MYSDMRSVILEAANSLFNLLGYKEKIAKGNLESMKFTDRPALLARTSVSVLFNPNSLDACIMVR